MTTPPDEAPADADAPATWDPVQGEAQLERIRLRLGRDCTLTVAAISLPLILAMGIASGNDLALGFALGALLGLANILLLSRAIARGIVRVLGPSPAEAEKRPKQPAMGLQSLIRLPLLMLALAFILWYMPARPEGLVAGYAISLFAAVVASLRVKRHFSDSGPSSD